MASTYSTSLKLQLMATGENTGTWGTVTNTNLGTALEEAITGSVDVTFASADVTLTLTNSNAAQTARNMRLVLTGTSGGARQLVVPALEKIYIVQNNLADACTVKVSGQTGVSVPAGKTMWLCNDGTDVKDVVTHLSSLTLSSPLPVSSGGTGATALNGLSFTGENITSLNASNISTGTIANARTTAASANGASTIVTRDASGNFSANTITANLTGTASSATSATQVANNLTLATSGTGLSGSATFNGSSAQTFTVTSNASSANGASTIVARDASGNFSANTVTANLTGTASNATVLQTARNFSISGGATASAVSFNGSGNVDLSVTGLNASSISSGTLSVNRMAAGSIVNSHLYTFGTNGTVSGYTLIPIDNTTPLITEGAAAFSTSYTPATSTPIIYIQAVVNFCSSVSSRILTAALFDVNTSTCLGVAIQHEANNGYVHQLVINVRYVPGNNAARTYQVRVSDNGGSLLYINSNGATGIFNGLFYSSISFLETTAT